MLWSPMKLHKTLELHNIKEEMFREKNWPNLYVCIKFEIPQLVNHGHASKVSPVKTIFTIFLTFHGANKDFEATVIFCCPLG